MPDVIDNRAFYDSDAQNYDSRWGGPGGERTNRAQLEIVRAACSGWSNRDVLEVGCGTGRFSEALARLEVRLSLTDLAPQMLAATRDRLERCGLDHRLGQATNGSIYELPFPDASFDCALSLNVFNHLDNVGRALSELARVLKPGGQLLINYPNVNSYYWPAAQLVNLRSAAIGQSVYSRWFRPTTMRRMIEDAGFAVTDWYGHVHVPRRLDSGWTAAMLGLVDRASRRGVLSHLAPIRFCLCSKQAAIPEPDQT